MKHEDGKLEECVLLNKKDQSGTHLDVKVQMERPVRPIWDPREMRNVGYEQDQDETFSLSVSDSTNTGKRIG